MALVAHGYWAALAVSVHGQMVDTVTKPSAVIVFESRTVRDVPAYELLQMEFFRNLDGVQQSGIILGKRFLAGISDEEGLAFANKIVVIQSRPKNRGGVSDGPTDVTNFKRDPKFPRSLIEVDERAPDKKARSLDSNEVGGRLVGRASRESCCDRCYGRSDESANQCPERKNTPVERFLGYTRRAFSRISCDPLSANIRPVVGFGILALLGSGLGTAAIVLSCLKSRAWFYGGALLLGLGLLSGLWASHISYSALRAQTEIERK